MRRRSTAGGKPVKARRRKTVSSKRRAAPKVARRRSSSAAGPETEVARLKRELREALERQAATAEILGVISSSPGDLEPVFEAMLANASRLCEASYGAPWLCEGDAFRTAAFHGPLSGAFMEQWQVGNVFHLGPELPAAHAAASRMPVQVEDLRDTDLYSKGEPLYVTGVDIAGIRTLLAVPMLKDDAPVGVIVIFRREVKPFSDRQIELLQNFAAQAVIAIENTRLLSELRQSLEQQTATSEVLRVISSSPGDLEPVFQAMLENATRICEAKFGSLSLSEGDTNRVVAMHNAPPAYAELRQREPTWKPTGLMGRVSEQAIASKRAIQIADLAGGIYKDDPLCRTFTTTTQARSFVMVPLLKENELIGVMAIYRQEVRPFTDKHIELLTNFAAQAVIAIENTRLLSELRQSLEQQTATADVLRVISSSPGELEPVFQAMLANATRICEAEFGVMFRFDGDEYMRWRR